MAFQFSTKEVSIDEIPKDTSEFIKQADAFVEEITVKWKKVKTYNYKLDNGVKSPVTTYGQTINGEYWLARTSVTSSSQTSFEQFSKYLFGTDENGDVKDLFEHTRIEVQHSKVLDKWEPIPLEQFKGYDSLEDKEHLKNWCCQKVFYELGAPLTTREFNQFMLIIPEKQSPVAKSAYIVQLVAATPVESGNVRGVYVSIERIRQLDNGDTEWTMCTSSDSGGNVPKWLQNSMISKSVSGDVPGFLNWVATK